jgi:aspartate aminotransferase
VAAKLSRENGLSYEAAQVVISGGAKQSLSNVLMAVINPGDEVVIPVPAWVSYVEMVKLAGGVNVLVPAGIEQDFKITPQQLDDAITPHTRLVMLTFQPVRERLLAPGTAGAGGCAGKTPACDGALR